LRQPSLSEGTPALENLRTGDKMLIVKRIPTIALFIVAATFAVAALAQTSGEPSSAATEPATDPGVQTFLTAWVTAWNAHDADAILNLHAKDCATVNRVGLFFIDKKSLTPQMERLQKQVFKDTQFPPFRILHQRSITPDLVILQAAWKIPSMPPPAAQTNGDMIITFVLKRSGTAWLAEEVDTHDVVPPPPGYKP
jgi:uncharacterized protein (TIGR02246 family)